MEPITYICETYPALSIGGKKEREVKFRRGRFIAVHPWQKELIESNDHFNVFIFRGESHQGEPVPPSPQPAHTSAKRGDETEHAPPEGGDQTHVREAKSGEGSAKKGLAPAKAAEKEAAPADHQGAFDAPPEFKVSKTAVEVLEKAGIAVPAAAEKLGLQDGDRLTVKMAEDLANE